MHDILPKSGAFGPDAPLLLTPVKGSVVPPLPSGAQMSSFARQLSLAFHEYGTSV